VPRPAGGHFSTTAQTEEEKIFTKLRASGVSHGPYVYLLLMASAFYTFFSRRVCKRPPLLKRHRARLIYANQAARTAACIILKNALACITLLSALIGRKIPPCKTHTNAKSALKTLLTLGDFCLWSKATPFHILCAFKIKNSYKNHKGYLKKKLLKLNVPTMLITCEYYICSFFIS
jgi:hypothetical protein